MYTVTDFFVYVVTESRNMQLSHPPGWQVDKEIDQEKSHLCAEIAWETMNQSSVKKGGTWYTAARKIFFDSLQSGNLIRMCIRFRAWNLQASKYWFHFNKCKCLTARNQMLRLPLIFCSHISCKRRWTKFLISYRKIWRKRIDISIYINSVVSYFSMKNQPLTWISVQFRHEVHCFGILESCH